MGKSEIRLRPNQEFITLQSLLQVAGVIDTGGMAKAFLGMEIVKVNDIEENRRGRKLYPGDVVEVSGQTFLVVES